ncbi:MAG: JAB domain-containing protein, partial [Pacificimonas sp.]
QADYGLAATRDIHPHRRHINLAGLHSYSDTERSILASLHHGISVDRSLGSVDSALRGEPGFLCRRRNTGHLGLSAAFDAHSRIGKDKAPSPEAERELFARIISSDIDKSRLDLATTLLESHGSIIGVVEAVVQGRAADVPEPVVHLLLSAMKIMAGNWRSEAFTGPVLERLSVVARYLIHETGLASREQFRVLYLNARNHLLSDQILWEGSVDSVQIHVREVVRNILNANATAVIFAHNHPGRSAKPSSSDIAITRELIGACASIGVKVHDHLIISGRTWVSMASEGYLPECKAAA